MRTCSAGGRARAGDRSRGSLRTFWKWVQTNGGPTKTAVNDDGANSYIALSRSSGKLLGLEQGALQVAGLGDREHLRMILPRAQEAADADPSAAVAGRLRQHREEVGQPHVE